MTQFITLKRRLTVIGLTILLLLASLVNATAQTYSGTTPTSSKNYVRATKVLVGGVYSDYDLNYVTGVGQTQQQIDYFDGLGRLQEQVTVGVTPTGGDLVRPVVYDGLGREAQTYLPYERIGGKGGFTTTTDALTAQNKFYTNLHGATDAAFAYSQKIYEPSPLDRVTEETAPGAAWKAGSGHTATVSYGTNTSSEVKLWTMSGTILSQFGYYNRAELFVTETTDPDKGKVREYKNKLGQVVETRQIAAGGTETLTTGYVYDDRGNLCRVIPPKAQALTANSAEFNKLVYTYAYDAYNRLTTKQLPGAEPELYVYDSRHRLVMSQDGNQRAALKWRIFYYDYLNRPAADGLVASGSYTHDGLQGAYKTIFVTSVLDTASLNYSFPVVTGAPTLTLNGVLGFTYYDRYYNSMLVTFGFTASDFAVAAPDRIQSVKGQITGSKVKVLDGNEENANAQWLTTITYYDDKYRPIQVKHELYTGATKGLATVSTNYHFDGAVDRLREKQVFNTTTTTTDLRYTYDNARRPVNVYHKVNSQAETLLSATAYDALGRAKTKTMGNAEAVNYAYNIRNWLTEIKSNPFTANLYYNTLPTLPTGSLATAQFGGNIAAVVSKQGTATTYGYAYDGFSRLKEGIHTNAFNEKLITYDPNGNITALTRQGGTNAGVFTYTYDGNKLSQLKIGATPYNYTYDANGNTTMDGMRGFTMGYNLLNLPKSISKGTDKLEYVYDAAGTKLAKKKNSAFTQFYAGSVVYKADKTPDYLMHAEGIAPLVGSTFAYQYNFTDHLGNVRAVEDAAKAVVQRNDYFPFGLAHGLANLNKNKYLYNGKELQDEVLNNTSFGVLDYGARMYDPVIIRYGVPDRFAEKYHSLSPYNYCAGNPISFIDVNGDSLRFTSSEKSLLKETEGLINEGIGSKVAKIDKNGNLSLKNLSEKQLSKLSDEQKAFYEVMKSAVDADGNVSIGIVSGSEDIMVGSYGAEQIDIADVNVFGTGDVVNKFSTFGHEVAEQQQKQLNTGTAKGAYSTAHFDYGVPAEEKISGYRRANERPISGGSNGNQLYGITYRKSGAGTVNVIMTTNNGNVKKIEKKR